MREREKGREGGRASDIGLDGGWEREKRQRDIERGMGDERSE